MTLPLHPLGRTGLAVSQLGFGGAVMGIADYLSPGERGSESFRAQVDAALAEALRLGINWFDTAPGYGSGRSESFLGQALEGVRDRVHISTKVPVAPGHDRSSWDESLGSSLERLRSDHVELLQLHGSIWSDELADWVLDEPVDWLDEVRARGLARFVGVTAELPTGGLERLIVSGRFDVLQVAYNAIYQGACDYQREPAGVIPLAHGRGMGVLTMRTATSGVLQKLLAGVAGLSAETVARLAVRFVLSTPEVDCALVGMSDVAEVRANCALAADLADRFDLGDLHNRFLA